MAAPEMTHDAAAMSRRLAEWVHATASAPPRPATAERARAVLLDSLACAFYAGADGLAAPILHAVRRLGESADCTVIGTSARCSLPVAGFANGSLIRLLDLNDSYVGPRQMGHPSDNIGPVLAAAELADRNGADLLQAIRLAYEIYGRILDLGDPESPLDHVTASGIVVSATCGWLLRLPVERLTNAIALSAMHTNALGEIRVGKVSGAKGIANSVVAQTALLLTLLAAEGVTGPERALEGARGFAKLALDGVDFSRFFDDSKPERLLSVSLKQYPCFALGQGPISAAIELSKRLPDAGAIDKLTITLANTAPARLRLSDAHGRMPTSSEAADHSIYFLVAVALLDGRFGLDQLRSQRWNDADVRGLMARMEAITDNRLQPISALPCRIEVTAGGAQYVVERPHTPGSAAHPLPWSEVVDKFRHCAAGVLDEAAQSCVVELVGNMDNVSSTRLLLHALTPHRRD